MDWLISIVIVFGIIGFGIFLGWFLDKTDTTEIFLQTIAFCLFAALLILAVIMVHEMIL